MRNKNYILRVMLAALAISLFLAFVLPVNAQITAGNSSNSGDKPTTITDDKTELVNGNWILTERNTQVFNNVGVTMWSGSEQDLMATCQWKDILNVEHTVSSIFKWEEPSRIMAPGSYEKFHSQFIKEDYSTTANIQQGIKVRFDRLGTDFTVPNSNAIEVLNLSKDKRKHDSEEKTGFFYAPKTLLGETNDILMIVDCFIGQDHYITTYTYTWSSDGNQAMK